MFNFLEMSPAYQKTITGCTTGVANEPVAKSPFEKHAITIHCLLITKYMIMAVFTKNMSLVVIPRSICMP